MKDMTWFILEQLILIGKKMYNIFRKRIVLRYSLDPNQGVIVIEILQRVDGYTMVSFSGHSWQWSHYHKAHSISRTQNQSFLFKQKCTAFQSN